MQLLVTGGLGFIGSNLVRHLLKQYPNYTVINLDAVTYAGHPENLADIASNPRYKFVKGQIEDAKLINSIVSGERFGPIHGIINLAAETHVDRSIHDPAVFVNTNVFGTQVLLEAALEHGLRKAKKDGGVPIRFVQVSTDEVYGSLGPTGYFTEETPLAPNSPYSASKAAADLLVRSYVHTFGLPALITRCSNNYGPYQFPEKLIPLFISNLLRDEPVPVYGDGLNVRDWIHVRDHCAGIYRAWRGGRPGEVYNLGGRCELTNLDLTHTLLRTMGKPATLIRHVKDRPGHDRRYAIDCTKAERELGWRPAVPFEDGLRETVRWYQENAAWVAAVRS